MKYYYPEHLTGYERIKAEGKRSWDEIHGAPDGFEQFSSRGFLERILPRLQFSVSRPKVLEYGCGTGPGACYLAEKGFEVDAIDLIPTAIELARQIACERGLDIRYWVQDICELPHEGKKYDLIVDSYCLQGIVTDADRRKVFLAVQARLKRNGYYLISTAMRNEDRIHAEDAVTDPENGTLFHRYRGDGLLDRETGLVYKPLEGKPTEYDGTLRIGESWYLLNRRHLTAETLRSDIEENGFKVGYQDGDYGENVVSVLPGAPGSSGAVSAFLLKCYS